ncbi:MAG: flavin reductase family protein [Tannerellaceae bacterium]|jgi:flavin reductase (DIM6/NTAB) family NADH-FMN oxidoreductase RutF|nr:flavin reductase family protein [Tannerellaceae bacterium]
MKVKWKPGTLVYPLPAVLVSCGREETGYNILTIAWVGTICSNPPMCYISVRPERHSHGIISREKEYVINLTTKEMAFAVDWCGVMSGRDVGKFEEMKLTPVKSTVVSAPAIAEAPLSIECRVVEVKSLGSHDMFISEVVNILADDRYLPSGGRNPNTEPFDLEAAGLLSYAHGKYYELGGLVGKFGWSVKKKK